MVIISVFRFCSHHILYIYVLYILYYIYYILENIGQLARMSVLDTEVDGSNPGSSMLFP